MELLIASLTGTLLGWTGAIIWAAWIYRMKEDRPFKYRSFNIVTIVIVFIVLALAVTAKLEAHEVIQLIYEDEADPAPTPEPPPADCPRDAGALNWYVAPEPDGKDDNLGICGSPMLSLSRAFERARGAEIPVTVWVKGGRYDGEVVDNRASYEHGLTVRCWPEEICTMNGMHARSFFYRYRGTPGGCQNITFEDINVIQYINWGFIFSDPEFRNQRERRDENWNGCNIIRNVGFREIGSEWGCRAGFDGRRCKGFGAITGQNSDGNLVENVDCIDLLNDNGGGIHCIYWSNGSSDNHVVNPRATNISAPAFKSRDDSNNNVWMGLRCERVDVCFYSGMPDSRPEETQDRNATVQIAVAAGVETRAECKLQPGGSTNRANCRRVFAQ